MHIVGTAPAAARRVTGVEVADLELAGTWVVDVRRGSRSDRSGWVVEWEDDIVFLADSPDLPAEAAPERRWPLDAA
jgi:hypothetical protein